MDVGPKLQVFFTKCHRFGRRSRHPARFLEAELPRGVPTPKGAPKNQNPEENQDFANDVSVDFLNMK